jgi:uncharacterized membrane protein
MRDRLERERVELKLGEIRKYIFMQYVYAILFALCFLGLFSGSNSVKPIAEILFIVVLLIGVIGRFTPRLICPSCGNHYFSKGKGIKNHFNTFSKACLHCGIRYDLANIDHYT